MSKKTKEPYQTMPVELSKPIGTIEVGIHYFYAPDVWFVDTTQDPYIVYIRDTQIKVKPDKFRFYDNIEEIQNG